MFKDTIRLSGILLIICALSTALVSAAVDITTPIINDRREARILEGYQEVLPQAGTLTPLTIEADKTIQAVMQSKVNDTVNGYIYTVTPSGYGGKITMLLGITYPQAQLTGVKIMQHTETPGLGGKCTEPAFIGQFVNKSLTKPLAVSKNAANPQEIQAITASTVTSRAVVKGVNRARTHYTKNYASLPTGE